jgi:hypothetical protein
MKSGCSTQGESGGVIVPNRSEHLFPFLQFGRRRGIGASSKGEQKSFNAMAQKEDRFDQSDPLAAMSF